MEGAPTEKLLSPAPTPVRSPPLPRTSGIAELSRKKLGVLLTS